jgi:hypothetical protein
MKRHSTGMWLLHGHLAEPGVFIVGGPIPAGKVAMDLVLDSAATTDVAGPQWQNMLTDITADGSRVEGVGVTSR